MIGIFSHEWAGLPDCEIEPLVETAYETIGMIWKPARLLALSELRKTDIYIWEDNRWFKSFLKPLEIDSAILE